MPAQLTQLTVIAQKLGAMHLASPQMTQHARPRGQGQTYILGQGPAVAAGGAVEFNFCGLPNTPTWPRNLSLLPCRLDPGSVARSTALAEAHRRTPRPNAQRLEARREKLFEELTALEESYRAGRIDPSHYASRRQQLVASLERIYAALDEEAAA